MNSKIKIITLATLMIFNMAVTNLDNILIFLVLSSTITSFLQRPDGGVAMASTIPRGI